MLSQDIEQIVSKLNTVEELLKLGHLVRTSPSTIEVVSQVQLTTIMDTEACLVGTAFYQKLGDELLLHKHEGLVQYLIQYKGKVAITFGGGGYRVLGEGDCAKIHAGELHRVTALLEDSRQIFICVPAEKGYSIDRARLLKEQLGELK